jgi:hypothetical protein
MMRNKMTKEEIGRMLLGNVSLIEYDELEKLNPKYFLQVGIVGFFATQQELDDLYGVLNYYYNMDSVQDTVISIRGE